MLRPVAALVGLIHLNLHFTRSGHVLSRALNARRPCTALPSAAFSSLRRPQLIITASRLSVLLFTAGKPGVLEPLPRR